MARSLVAWLAAAPGCGGAQPAPAPAPAAGQEHAASASHDPAAHGRHHAHGEPCERCKHAGGKHAHGQHGDGQHGDGEHGHGEHGDRADHEHRADHVRHDFSDPERFARAFDSPERDPWQRPAEVVALLALAPGHTVVDLGAGTGYFLEHLAPAVQPGGRVLGLDVEANMVAYMSQRIAREGIEGASARAVALDDPGLEPASVDRVLVVNTWHHIAERVAYARKLHQSLRPGGFVLVVDFTMETRRGPPPSGRLEPGRVVEELRQAGFEAETIPESLPDQYVVRARKP